MAGLLLKTTLFNCLGGKKAQNVWFTIDFCRVTPCRQLELMFCLPLSLCLHHYWLVFSINPKIHLLRSLVQNNNLQLCDKALQ